MATHFKILEAIRQTATGALVIDDWLGSGGNPVSVLDAERRASICSGCPKNVTGGWINRLKQKVADTIREHLSVKNGIGLTVSNEDRIGFCEQCGCALQLKVWCPIEHIMRHTAQSDVLNYPAFCWIRKELTST